MQNLQLEQLKISQLLDLKDYPHASLFENIEYPWEALSRLPQYLTKIIDSVPEAERNKGKLIGPVYIDSNVIIGQGTVVEHGAMIKGPAVIGNNCELRKGAYFRGNVLLGNNVIIGNSTELKQCIVFDQAQISHFNYAGDSVIARKAHMAAGAITSNLKLDSSPVTIQMGDVRIPTNLKKFGAFLGQHCQIGSNAVLNPGSIIGAESVVYAGASFRGYLPPRHICKVQQSQTVVTRL